MKEGSVQFLTERQRRLRTEGSQTLFSFICFKGKGALGEHARGAFIYVDLGRSYHGNKNGIDQREGAV